MTNLSFSRFIESTENRLSKSYFPLGAFNPSEEDYGVLNEVNQENLEKAWKGKITNSNVYIDQIEANWLMQFETRHHAVALQILYSDILLDAKRVQMEEAERMGENPELLKDLNSSEGLELWEATLPALKDHTYNPSKSQKKFNVSKDFNFGDMATGAMGLLDKLERPVNYKLLKELENKFKENPSEAQQEYLSEENSKRGVCGYNLYYDPSNITKKISDKSKEEKIIFEDFQSMTLNQAGKIMRQYQADVQMGLMGKSAKFGDVKVGTKFKQVTGGKLADLPMYQMDFEGNMYVNEINSEHQHVLDIETIEALIDQEHPSFKHIEVRQVVRREGMKAPYDKRTKEEFWPSFMPGGFSAPSSSVRKARMSHQDTMGKRQNGTFVAVDIPQLNKVKKYLPPNVTKKEGEGPKRAGGSQVAYYEGKCAADVLLSSLDKDFSGKVPVEVLKEHESLVVELENFEGDIDRIQNKKIDSTFVQHISVNRPLIVVTNPEGKELTRRQTVGKGSPYKTMGGFESGNVTETFPLNPANPDAVLLSNIMNNLVFYKKDKSLAQLAFDGITKDKNGNWREDIKSYTPEQLINNESKIVDEAEEHLLYLMPGEPNILRFLEGFLEGMRKELQGDEKKVSDYVLNGLKNDPKLAEDVIKNPDYDYENIALKKLFTKAQSTGTQKARSFIASIIQPGLDDRDKDKGEVLGAGSRERGALAISKEVEKELEDEGIEISPSNMHKAWLDTTTDFVQFVNNAYNKKERPEFEVKMGPDGKPTILWWDWAFNKFKENLGIEKDSQAIDKMYGSKDVKDMFKQFVNEADSRAIEKLKTSLSFPSKEGQPQGIEQQPQQPQQSQQQPLGKYQIPELGNPNVAVSIPGDPTIRTAEDLRKKLNDFFAQTKFRSPEDVPNQMYKMPVIQKAVELGFPGFEDRPDEEIVRELPQEKDESVNSVILASKDDLVSILSESNGEKVFETIKEQLALRKDVCEIIASAELEKQRNNL